MDTTEIVKYLDMATRRKYWIIISCLAAILAGLTYGMISPKIYRGETTILVVPQRVPETYVRSLVAANVEERLRTIRQQVLSRSNLERIIKDFQMFSDKNGVGQIEGRVLKLRKRIEISVHQDAAFTISFEHEEPKTAMDVANRLAGNFISENLTIREERVLGTSEFLQEELLLVQRVLEEKERKVGEYREKHLGQLPENMTTNLNTLNRLQNQLEQLNTNLREAEQRKVAIQQQLSSVQMMESQLEELGLGGVSTALGAGETESAELRSMRHELSTLQAKYTENHPDVVRLKKIIEKMEARKDEKAEEPNVAVGSTLPHLPSTEVSMASMLRPELERVNLELQQIRAEIQKVKGQVAHYERIVEHTPRRENELISLMRDYENLKGQYNSLLQRKLEAEIALSMERKQKGEQFRIIDPAKYPEAPVRPDLRRILLLAALLGLGVGGGLGYFRELMDTSYKVPEEVEKELGIKMLVSIPYRYTDRELRNRKRREVFKGASVGVGFAVGAVAILLATKGVDKTLDFFKNLMGMS